MEDIKKLLNYYIELPIATIYDIKDIYLNNHQLFLINCPYCYKKHSHLINIKNRVDIKSSHCFNGDYRIILP